jgi:glycerol-3-phosphate dehydrogenase
LTATDVISRRLRLSFLNAQAALEALPRVIDIMAEELNWNAARRQQEIKQTTQFLQSMGLPPGTDLPAPARSSHWYDWAYRLVGTTATTNSHGRAQFEAGEADSLRAAFLEQSRDSARRLDRPAVWDLLHGIPAYAGIRTKDFEYVLEETGLAKQELIDMDEFVEVRAPSIPPSRLGGLLTFILRECVWISYARNLRMCRSLPCPERLLRS